MKRSFIIFVFTLLVKFSIGQTYSIIGAWYWRDSTTETSFLFKKDGSLSMHTGSKGKVILSKNTKKGTFTYNDDMLVIKWQNSEIETNALKFIDENTIQITFADKGKKRKERKRVLIFNRIVDKATFEN